MNNAMPEYRDDPVAFSAGLLRWFAVQAGARREADGVSVLDHACRTAELARLDGAADTDITAALLHDIGMLMLDDQCCNAAKLEENAIALGSSWLARRFPGRVSEPVRLSIMAKRWLLAIDRRFRVEISEDSFRRLAEQGGPLIAAERGRLEQHANWQQALALARWHERARISDAPAPPIQTFQPCVTACLVHRLAGRAA